MKKVILIIIGFLILFAGYSIFDTPSYDTIDITRAIEDARSELNNIQEIIVFDSKNPFNFYDIFNRIDEVSYQKVYGILTKPDTIGVFPIIIGVAGSAGWGKHHYEYLERYVQNGFATFSLHSFKSRNVESTIGEQLSVTIPMVIYDAFKALKQLSIDPQIDAQRAGITGWSLGGGVALFAGWEPIQKIISPNMQFAAYLPFYPPCMIMPDELKMIDAPMHILAGELDDWVPAAACKELVLSAKNEGYNIGLTIYPGASHSFDRSMDVILDKKAYSFTDCRMRLTKNGVVELMNGFPLSSPILQKIGLSFCAEKGAHWGGNKHARDLSKEFALSFMKKYLFID